ncbi:MAG: hypothetical protein IKP40_13990 [Clostridia bacterium]|nr:hypothetical protein [Clostridia bacterium]
MRNEEEAVRREVILPTLLNSTIGRKAMVCGGCNAEVGRKQKYCHNCGRRLVDEAAAGAAEGGGGGADAPSEE